MSIFRLKNVGYNYDGTDVKVLENIEYDFEKGKMYAIVGKSGSGKTTLLSLMAGLTDPKEGEIIYDGTNIAKLNKDHYRSKNVGVVFQSFNLLGHLTALENVILSIDISGIKVANKKTYAKEILNKVGINEEKSERRVLKLSGGEQQRVAIARALSYNPNVILADEPTGNLDRKTEEGVVDILRKLAKEDNKCVIIVTHSEDVSKAVDEIYNLEKKEKIKDIVY